KRRLASTFSITCRICRSAESTANGYGTYHHKQIMRALKGNSRFRLLFYPWYVFEEYVSQTPLTGALDEKEDDLREKFNVTDAQLQWRREKIEELEGDENLFCQEYPSTIEEAFLVTGGTMFPSVKWTPSDNWIRAREWSRELGGSFHLLSSHLETSKGSGLSDGRSLALPGLHYSMGADCAGGTGNDYSEAQVVCLETMEQVATFRSNTISPPRFAESLSKIGAIFNKAYLVPESNQHGLSVLACLRVLEPYKSHQELVYRSRVPIKSQMLDRARKIGALGFKTSSTNKYLLIGILQNLIDELTLYDEITVDQLRGFGEREEGRLGNIESGHDDSVMALALACEGILKLRLRYPPMVEVSASPKPPPATVIDFDDIFSRIRPRQEGWKQHFQKSEAVHGQGTRR
ncbi:MAG: hypothetical protein ACWGQW_04760, partial [bacterium]